MHYPRHLALLLFFCLLSHPMHGTTTLQNYIEKHAQAFTALQPYIATIIATQHRGREEVWYTYDYPVTAAKPLHEHYLSSYQKLQGLLMTHAVGNGFVIGCALATINRLVCSNINDKRIAGLGLLISLATVFYRNYSLESIPYFSSNLQQNNVVSIGNFCGYALLTLVGAMGSYYGTHCALTTFTDN